MGYTKWMKKGREMLTIKEEDFEEREAEDIFGETGQEEEETEDEYMWEQDDKIRITMLGTTSSGKTAFLSGVHQSMITGYDTDIHLEINKEYDEKESYASIQSIAMVDLDGRVNAFPTGTNETKLYGLVLAGRSKKYCDFEFMDYRGAMVKEISPGTETAPESEVLKRQLIRSNCILVFLDAVKVSQFQDVNARTQRCQIYLINQIFTSLLKGWVHPYHVIVVLTKVDDTYVKAEDKENNYKKLCEKAMEICGTIANISQTFSIIPVSAVGEGNTVSREQRVGGEIMWTSELKKDAFPVPMNIDLVILHACRRILEEKQKALQREIRKLEEQQEELEKEMRGKRIPNAGMKAKWEEIGSEIVEKRALKQELKNNIDDMKAKKLDNLADFIYYEKSGDE